MEGTFYDAPNDYRNYLAHHGVKGMKWGVRHDKPRLGYRRYKKLKNTANENFRNSDAYNALNKRRKMAYSDQLDLLDKYDDDELALRKNKTDWAKYLNLDKVQIASDKRIEKMRYEQVVKPIIEQYGQEQYDKNFRKEMNRDTAIVLAYLFGVPLAITGGMIYGARKLIKH